MRPLVCVIVLGLAQTAAAAVLRDLRVVGGPSATVRIELSAPVGDVVAKALPPDGDRPARVYVDLPATSLGTGPSSVAGSGDLLRVRTGQFDATTVRVVLDLATPASCTVRSQGRSITLTLGAPPVAAAPRARAPEPLAQRERPPAIAAGTIVLDPGHGGHDPGATGIDGLVEKELALEMSHLVAERLRARVTNPIVLTRTDDTYLSIDERVARVTDAAVFVSLHANAAAETTLAGVEVYYGGGDIDPVSPGSGWAARLGRAMVTAVERRFPRSRTLVAPGGFGVVVRNQVPSVLVEVGYLTNAGDAARLRDAHHRARVAEAVADGVVAFLRDRAPVGVVSR